MKPELFEPLLASLKTSNEGVFNRTGLPRARLCRPNDNCHIWIQSGFWFYRMVDVIPNGVPARRTIEFSFWQKLRMRRAIRRQIRANPLFELIGA